MHVVELQAGQLGLVGVGLGVEPGPEEVDDLDPPLLAGAGLEQLLLAGADRPVLHRALDDLQALGDLVRVGGGAVAAEQELADVGRAPGTGRGTAGPGPCGRGSRRRPRRRAGRGRRVRSSVLSHRGLALGEDLVRRRRRARAGRARPRGPRPSTSSMTLPASPSPWHARRCSTPASPAWRAGRPSHRPAAPLNSTTSVSPRHLTLRDLRPASCRLRPAAVTVSRGTTHSCGLTPPCSYSWFASKQVMPGASAIRTSLSQSQGTVGDSTSAPSFRRAHRPFFVTSRRRRLEPSSWASPPAARSQPWSVTT